MQKTLTYILFGLLGLFLISGCITKRGHGLNTGNLVKGADGIWRLKSHTRTPPPKITKPIIEKLHKELHENEKIPPAVVTPPVPKPVEFPAARVRPTPTEPKSAVPHPSPVVVEPSQAKFPPFQPSVSSTKNVNVRPATLPIEEENVDNESINDTIVKVNNWKDLGMFYLILILIALGSWISWRMWSEWQTSKRLKLAMERQAELIDKKKKAAKKRKPAKKKVVKKKKLDTKNQRKSTQAARKKPKSS